MGNFCILRCEKLHGDGSVGGSVSHALRTRETLNADTERTPKNWTNWQHKEGDKWVCDAPGEAQKKAMARYRDLLKNTKARKNGVQAVELMMTVSPEAMKRKDFKITDYLNDCDKWAKDIFGEKNVFLIVHHRDETTPHTSILLVPRYEKTYKDGHKEWVLSAKKWLGGREKLRELQSDFYEKVGKVHGLERGIEGSKAHHQDIKKFYAKVEKAKDNVRELVDNLPKKKVLESVEKYKERLAAQIMNCISPLIQEAEKQKQNEDRIKDLERKVNEVRTQQKADKEAYEAKNYELEAQIDKEAERRAKERYKGLSDADKAKILESYKWADKFISGEPVQFDWIDGFKFTCGKGKNTIRNMWNRLDDYETLQAYDLEQLAKKMKLHGFVSVRDARDFAEKKGISDITEIPEKPKQRYQGFLMSD